MTYALFPGCLIPSRLPFLESTTMKVLSVLKIEIKRIEDFSCCFDPIVLKSLNIDTWLAIATRNLAIAEQKKLDVLTLCNGCFSSLNEANYLLKNEDGLKEKVSRILREIGREYRGIVQVTHISKLLHELGPEMLKKEIKNDLKDFRVASQHGCHLVRPSEIAKIDDPRKPAILDELSKWAGAIPVSYSDELICCGSGLMGTEEHASLGMLSNLLKRIQNSEANCIVTSCPFCFLQMDYKQKEIGLNKAIPVLYITELLSIAFGLSGTEMGFKYHRVPVVPVEIR